MKNLLVRLKRLVGIYLKYFIYDLVFSRPIRGWKPDIVHAHDLATLPCAVRVAAIGRQVVLYDAHEMEQYRNPPLTRIQRAWIRWIERHYGRRADQVITVSDEIASFLKVELGKQRVTVLYNSPQESSCAGPRSLRQDCALSARVPLLVFVGGVFINRGVDNLVRALQYLPGYHLAVVGPQNADVVRELNWLVEQTGVGDRWHLFDPVPAEQVVPYIASADIGVYSIRNIARSYDFSMPNKLFEMTFAGLPIALSNLTSARRFVNSVGNGLVFDEEDPQSIARVVSRIYESREDFLLSKEKMDALYDLYGWPTQVDKLVELLEQHPEKAV